MTWNRRYIAKSYIISSLWVVPFVSVLLFWIISRITHGLGGWLLANGLIDEATAFFGLTITGARSGLETIVTANLSFLVFTFSSLLVAIQVASGQYTPRIIATTILQDNPASNDRDWQMGVAVLPYTTVSGEQVTITNIRNLNYRTESDFDLHYYDKTFDLNRLDSVDLIAVYWMGDAIAHIMVSFGFQEQDFVTFSIETRKEQGEEYSNLKGFFKQYELIFIVGDERDLIRVRTDFRKPPEDAYLYRTHITPENSRKFFIEYIRQINSMSENPEWYNTLTTNCTTDVVRLNRAYDGQARYNWKVLLSSYAPQYAYENGSLDTRIPFEELQELSYINPKARAVGDDPEFSRKIRENLPRPQSKSNR
jgi:hypothetical protein